MNKSELNVVYGFSDNDEYALQIATSIISLYENNKHLKVLNIFIFFDKLRKETKTRLTKIAEKYNRTIEYKEISEIIKTIIDLDIEPYKGAYIPYCKYFFANYVPNNVESFIYMDTDTVFVNKMDDLITEMENLELEKSVIAAAGIFNLRQRKAIGLSVNDYTVGVGVMYFNCERWKNHKCLEKIISHIKKYGMSQYKKVDEDICNKIIREEFMVTEQKNIVFAPLLEFTLKQVYNLYELNEKTFCSEIDFEKAKKEPIILHYIGYYGHPWNEKSKGYPKSDIWKYYANKTPWRDYKLFSNKSHGMLDAVLRFLFMHNKALYVQFVVICKKINKKINK